MSWSVSQGLLRFGAEMRGLVGTNGVGWEQIWGKVAEDWKLGFIMFNCVVNLKKIKLHCFYHFFPVLVFV